MFKIISNRNLIRLSSYGNKLCKRLFLSEAFKCTEAWDNRLKAPVLQKLQFGVLYAELEKCFSSRRSVSVIDIDLFANGVTNDEYQDELENIIYKLRAEPETSIMFESTPHAVIRWYLSLNKKEELLNILSQRMLFGIFPDVYLSILMIDKFLKEKDYISSVKIAVLQMLQDDCNHPILRSLSLYSCIKYLNCTEIWETPQEVEDEDDEVVKVRIKFARNEYFDDHFDIVNTNHVVGKTMIEFGKTIKEPVGISGQLVGLIIYEKYDKAKSLIQKLIKENVPVLKDAVKLASEYLQDKPKQVVAEQDQEKKENKAPENSEESPVKLELKGLLNELNSKNLLNGTLEEEAKKLVEKEVEEHEKSYITKQIEVYKRWEKERLENIQKEIADQHKKSVQNEIEKLKRELEEEEKRIFYYDQEDEYNIIMKEKEIEKENVFYYKMRHKKKVAEEDVYVPPQVNKKFQ